MNPFTMNQDQIAAILRASQRAQTLADEARQYADSAARKAREAAQAAAEVETLIAAAVRAS